MMLALLKPCLKQEKIFVFVSQR
uniref:Uncharacterized protein n=1 Tax=Rhizophora mucronata TaxID=61149 RepID=A0A2P2PEW5_RHIMU